MERRSNATAVRALTKRGKDKQKVIVGTAAVYYRKDDPGTEYELFKDKDFRAVERIERGAFSDMIDGGAEVVATFNHDANQPLGRRTAGTLRIKDTPKGLQYQIEPPDTNAGRDVMTSLQRGDVKGSSFSFRVVEEKWEEFDNGALAVRTLKKVEAPELGPVLFPAYEGTGAETKADGGSDAAKRSYEAWKATTTEADNKTAQRAGRIRRQRNYLEMLGLRIRHG